MRQVPPIRPASVKEASESLKDKHPSLMSAFTCTACLNTKKQPDLVPMFPSRAVDWTPEVPVYQRQRPRVYQRQRPTVYQRQRPNLLVLSLHRFLVRGGRELCAAGMSTCPLSTGYYLLSTVYRLLFTVNCLLSTVCCPPVAGMSTCPLSRPQWIYLRMSPKGSCFHQTVTALLSSAGQYCCSEGSVKF